MVMRLLLNCANSVDVPWECSPSLSLRSVPDLTGYWASLWQRRWTSPSASSIGIQFDTIISHQIIRSLALFLVRFFVLLLPTVSGQILLGGLLYGFCWLLNRGFLDLWFGLRCSLHELHIKSAVDSVVVAIGVYVFEGGPKVCSIFIGNRPVPREDISKLLRRRLPKVSTTVYPSLQSAFNTLPTLLLLANSCWIFLASSSK